MKVHECWANRKDYDIGECIECKWVMVSIYRNNKTCYCSMLEIEVFSDQLMNCPEFERGNDCHE